MHFLTETVAKDNFTIPTTGITSRYFDNTFAFPGNSKQYIYVLVHVITFLQ